MYPRVKYGLADGHADEAADGTGPPAKHPSETSRLATAETGETDQASPENAAAAASAAASAHAAAVSA
jgi:hypothetical protein